jgi:hypothetical protein
MQGGLQFEAVVGIFDQPPPFFAYLSGVKVFDQGF